MQLQQPDVRPRCHRQPAGPAERAHRRCAPEVRTGLGDLAHREVDTCIGRRRAQVRGQGPAQVRAGRPQRREGHAVQGREEQGDQARHQDHEDHQWPQWVLRLHRPEADEDEPLPGAVRRRDDRGQELLRIVQQGREGQHLIR